MSRVSPRRRRAGRRPHFAADTRFHLRHETYNLDAEDEIGQWLAEGRVDLFAFNDHSGGVVAEISNPRKSGNRMVERTGLSPGGGYKLVARIVVARPPRTSRVCSIYPAPAGGTYRHAEM